MHIVHCSTSTVFVRPGISNIPFTSWNRSFNRAGNRHRRTTRIIHCRRSGQGNIRIAIYCLTSWSRSCRCRYINSHRVYIINCGARTIFVGPGIGDIGFASRDCAFYRTGHGHWRTTGIIHYRWRGQYNIGVTIYSLASAGWSSWYGDVDRHGMHIINGSTGTIFIRPGIGEIAFTGWDSTLYRAGWGKVITTRILNGWGSG